MKILRNTRAIAHSPNFREEENYLDDHLKAVAQLTAKLLALRELEQLAYYTGLWHDLGKYAEKWQRALREAIAYEQKTGERKRGLGVRHSMHGALLATKYSYMASFCIAGHHSGIPNRSDLDSKIKDAQAELDEVVLKAGVELPSLLPKGKLEPQFGHKLHIELMIRMLFSALVDADRLDAAAHALGQPYKVLEYPSIAELERRFQQSRARAIAKSTAPKHVNKVRQEIYDYCVQAGQNERGVYKLCAPTGGGKTFGLMGFSLAHAVKNGMRRVIYAAPFTSILEQTADIYRQMFGSDSILEHHSNAKEQDDTLNQIRLAVQNWDAPIIVTTNVQLLESLFSNRPSKCRKLHNVAGAVIVFDEVQTLPVELMTPILSMLENLVDYVGCSVLLCTATQPAYQYIKGFNCNPADVIPTEAIASHFKQLQRVNYRQIREPWSWAEVVADVQKRELKQVLIVANTIADAREGFKELQQFFQTDCYYLSTPMYRKHRDKVLKRVRTALKEKERCCLVSTQLIEAGVDLDFANGYRVFGPLDSVVQTAGRVNRNGKLERLGTLSVFTLQGGNYPTSDYKLCARFASRIFDEGLDLNAPATFEEYFRRQYRNKNTDPKRIQYLREAMEFERVANEFKLIDDNSESVFVAIEPEAHQLLHELENKGYLDRADFRRTQDYLVNLPAQMLEKR
jgi:CRISPR-associated endonuclease/helicase Cas3